MRIEGHFTADEIRSAVAMKATVEKLAYKKIALTFLDAADYETWIGQQKDRHPDLWGTVMVLTPKAPTARP